MRIKRIYLMIVFFLCIEFALSLYVLSYTSRVKRPVWSFESDEKITCIGMSSSGKSFAIGTAIGSITYFFRGKSQPEWTYHGRSNIESLALSADGDYLFAVEGNDKVLVFSDTPLHENGGITPRWTYRLPNCKMGGVFSARTIPPSIYYVVTSNDEIHLISNGEDLIWKFHIGAEDIVSTLSHDGMWIAVGDSNGYVHIFSIRNAEPELKIPTNLMINSIAISTDKQYIAISGATEQGVSEICLLTLEDGKILWNQRLDQSVDKVQISHDGSKVFTNVDDGSANIIFYDGISVERRTVRLGREIDSVISPPFGSYILASNPEGDVYLFFINRYAPLWKFSIDSKSPLVATTLAGEYILIAGSHQLNILSNIPFNEMISGSRIGWSIVFLLSISGVAVLAIFWKEGPLLPIFQLGDYLSVITGLSIGIVMNLFLFKKLSETAIIGSLGCAVGCYICWKREGFLNFLSGCYLGLLGSVTSGCFLALFFWFGGDERNVLLLMIQFVFEGLKLGLLYGPFGAIIGALLSQAYNLINLRVHNQDV